MIEMEEEKPEIIVKQRRLPKSQNIWYRYLVCGITSGSSTISIDCRVSKGCRKMYSVDKRSADGVTEAMEDGGITFILQICGYSTGKSFSGVGNNFVRALATEIEK